MSSGCGAPSGQGNQEGGNDAPRPGQVSSRMTLVELLRRRLENARQGQHRAPPPQGIQGAPSQPLSEVIAQALAISARMEGLEEETESSAMVEDPPAEETKEDEDRPNQ